LDVQTPRIKWQTGFYLPLQPSSSDIDFLFARQSAPTAFKSSQTRTGNAGHCFFSIYSKEEKLRPIPLRQNTCSEKVNREAAAVRPHNLKPLIN
jgi:hypothetical protein